MFYNVYHNRSYLNEPKPVPVQSFKAAETLKYETDSEFIELRSYRTGRTIKKYKKSRYFVKRESFNALEQPEQIQDFTETEHVPMTAEPEQVQEITEHVPMTKTSRNKLDSNAKYLNKFKEIKIRLSEEDKQAVQNRAEQQGLSVNAYILKLIHEDSQA